MGVVIGLLVGVGLALLVAWYFNTVPAARKAWYSRPQRPLIYEAGPSKSG